MIKYQLVDLENRLRKYVTVTGQGETKQQINLEKELPSSYKRYKYLLVIACFGRDLEFQDCFVAPNAHGADQPESNANLNCPSSP